MVSPADIAREYLENGTAATGGRTASYSTSSTRTQAVTDKRSVAPRRALRWARCSPPPFRTAA